MRDTHRPRADVAYDNFVLCCAGCGEGYLHQLEVEVFERSEDEELGFHVKVRGSSASIDRSLAGNPSFRREATVVRFRCENCCAITDLDIIQHKGNTYLEVSVSGFEHSIDDELDPFAASICGACGGSVSL